MSILDSIQRQIPPIHKEGYPFIGGFALASLILFWLWSPLGWIGTILTVWCALFFRDPVRVTPVRDGLVVSPADGRVSMITMALPPAELGLGDRPLPRISVFMSVFNCHVNRSPIAGRVDRIAYRPGLFTNAELDKASEDNERNSLVISTSNARIGVVQIAGLVAKRIVCFVKEGQSIGAGERGPGVRAVPLYEERIVLVVRRGHPHVKARVAKRVLEAVRHVEVHVAPGKGNRGLAASYAAAGLTRDIAVTVPTFTAAAAIVAATDFVASLPVSLVEVLGPRLGLRIVATPLRPVATPISLLWHERTEHDPALRAFRELIQSA